MEDESKAKSEQRRSLATAEDYDSENSRYLFDERSTLDCSILSDFGWTTTTMQQQQQNMIHRHHHHHHSQPIDDDPFGNDFATDQSIPKSQAASSSGLLRIADSPTSLSAANMRVDQQASASTNNPSVSSSSSDQDLVEKSPPPSAAQISIKKKGQKRIRQQRFAFVTKSEVDHLEDGYRWRKYGQKAVKNSPYPRSYYRCTNTKCTVKKRVERSCEDPTTVITTYEGQHCHQTAGFPRGGGLSIREAAFFGVQMCPLASQSYYPGMHLPQQTPQGSIAPTPLPASVSGESRDDSIMIVCTEPLQPPAGSTPQFPLDEGLLGDIVSPRLRNNFYP